MHESTIAGAVLCVELESPAATTYCLPTDQGIALVDAVAADLSRLLPGVEQLGLAAACALFDPAQVLRPGWPIFTELASLYRGRRDASVPAVMGFGSAGGRMARPALEPETALGGGLLRVLPLVLIGGPEPVADVTARMETQFDSQGLASAAVSLHLSQALGIEIVHARYMTRLDLCALTAIQLDHLALGPAWVVLEAALLSPGKPEQASFDPGPLLRYADDRMWIGMLGLHACCSRANESIDASVADFGRQLMLCRRLAALFTAHGLRPEWMPIHAEGDLPAPILASEVSGSGGVIIETFTRTPPTAADQLWQVRDADGSLLGFVRVADADAEGPVAVVACAWLAAADNPTGYADALARDWSVAYSGRYVSLAAIAASIRV